MSAMPLKALTAQYTSIELWNISPVEMSLQESKEPWGFPVDISKALVKVTCGECALRW